MASDKPDSFQCGPFEVARNPDVRQLVDKLNKLREAVDQSRIQPGVGYDVQRSTSGTTLSIRADRGGGIEIEEHPFMLKVRKKDKQNQFFVTQGAVGNNDVRISNQEKWVDFDTPANIYLEAEVKDMKITKLTIKSKKPDEEMKRVEIASGEQKYSRISIGLYAPTEPTKKDFRVVQNVRTNIPAALICSEGYPAVLLTQENYTLPEDY
jgi:hypothetical protein